MKHIFLTVSILLVNTFGVFPFELIQFWQDDNIKIDKVIVYKDPLVFNKYCDLDEVDDGNISWLNTYYHTSCPKKVKVFDVEKFYYSKDLIQSDSYLTKQYLEEYRDNWEMRITNSPDFFTYIIAEFDVTFIQESKKIKFVISALSSSVQEGVYEKVFLTDYDESKLITELNIYMRKSSYLFEDNIWKKYGGQAELDLLGSSIQTPKNNKILDHVSEYYLSTKDDSGNRTLELIKK